MEKEEFIDYLNNHKIQRYITHHGLIDTAYAAWTATETPDGIQVTGVWMNIAGKDVSPIGYDAIIIKNDDIKHWTFVSALKGNLSAEV